MSDIAKRTTSLLLIVFASLWLGTTRAEAHTEFESSNPADQDVIDQPVSEIEVVFAGVADPAGEGFVVLEASGETRTPDTVTSDDRLTWVLGFDPPLTGGTTGVRWSVAAPDAHPIEGSFSFTVSAPTLAGEDGAGEMGTEAGGGGAAAAPAGDVGQDLGSFLDGNQQKAPLAGAVGGLGRVLGLAGAMLAIGGVVFAFFVLRGTEADIRSVLYWVRRASVVLAAGALVEMTAQIAIVNTHWLTVWPLSTIGSVLWSPFGLAIGLRIVAAYLLLHVRLDVIEARKLVDPVAAMSSLAGVGARSRSAGPLPPADERAKGHSEHFANDGDYAWHLNTSLGVVFAGIGAALGSFLFDGHTVTEGVRLLTAFVDVVHVGAGAVWSGGLVMLLHVVWRRHRRGARSRALQLAVRFSVVAVVALVAAGLAGAILAVIVLDSPSELWSTPWGRLLMAKVAVVGVAALAGGYNHSVLIPRFAATDPEDAAANAEFRRTITIEGIAMGIIIVITAVLVGAAS